MPSPSRRPAARGGGGLGAATAWLLAGFALVATAGPLAAQRASPWLPPGHWSRSVLVRLHALGVATSDPLAADHPLLHAAAGLTGPYRHRLVEERRAIATDPRPGGTADPPPVAPAALLVELSARAAGRAGTVEPGRFTLDRQWTGPTPLADRIDAAMALRLEAAPHHRLALTVAARAAPDSATLDHATIDLAAGPLHLWGGRRRIGFPAGDGGGLVLTGLDRLDGGGLRLARPAPVPLLGSLAGELFAGPLGRSGHVERTWLLGMRVHARPHPRFDVGATRVALFGGMDGARVGPRQILEVLVAANLGGDYADDQVASADARWRPPAPLPLELYGEWGMHDIDFEVLFDMPTFTVGVRLPRLARLPGPTTAGASFEHTRISRSCCQNPPWYHHFELADGWTSDGALLGHPLGGHGHQWRLGISGDAGAAALVVDAAALIRSRGSENLYAPDREGRSAGLEVGADARLSSRASAALRLTAERGEDWTALAGALVARLRF